MKLAPRWGVLDRGRTYKIKRAENMVMTPPNLFGIERKMAYAHRKYHSGLMWVGVTRGFAGIKFSGSPRELGEKNLSQSSKVIMKMNPTESFIV